MKPRLQKQRNRALTRTDVLVLVVLFAIILLWAIGNMGGPVAKARAQQVNCINNLKQINLSLRIWAGDHNNEYLMLYSTNGSLPEWPATTNIAVYFQAMSNELITPKILICPADHEHIPATNWTTDFNNSHISYFLNPDASEAYPQEIMSGDDNLAINDVPVKSGWLLLSSNTPVSWTATRHIHVGNIAFADGSVAEESSSGLQNAFQLSFNGTPFTTNRIVIP
jgi:prepilin-type processing-associated H-X9-DG protein